MDSDEPNVREGLCKLGFLVFGFTSSLSGLILWSVGLTAGEWSYLGGFLSQLAAFLLVFQWYVRHTEGGARVWVRISSINRFRG